MKKVLLFAASAVLMISSCTKNEVFINPENQKAIEFGTYVGNNPTSKAETTKDNLASFYVTAFEEVSGTLSTTEYFKDILVSQQQDKSWKTSSPVYWPISGNPVHFYAYGPATDEIKTYGNGIATLNFTDFRTDYVFAKKKQSQTESTSVALTFNHILSRIQISAKVADEISAYSAVVSSLKFTNVSFANSAEMDLTNGTVTPGQTAFSGAVEFSPILNSTVSTNAQELTNENTTIFVAPTTSASTAKVEIAYTLYRNDLDDDKSTSVTKTAEITFTALEKGHSYNVVLTIPAAGSLTPITFTIDDQGFGWDSGDGISGNLQ